jgi:hypothetical protein
VAKVWYRGNLGGELMANGGAAATLKKITEAFAELHADIANEIQRAIRLERKASQPTAVGEAEDASCTMLDDFAHFERDAPKEIQGTSESEASALMRDALRSPHLHVSGRSDRYLVETPRETAAELIALALQRTQP